MQNQAPPLLEVANLHTHFFTLDGVVGDNGATAVSLVVGSGTVALTGTNGFTGGIYHNGGTLSWSADAPLNGNPINLNGGSLSPSAATAVAISFVTFMAPDCRRVPDGRTPEPSKPASAPMKPHIRRGPRPGPVPGGAPTRQR